MSNHLFGCFQCYTHIGIYLYYYSTIGTINYYNIRLVHTAALESVNTSTCVYCAYRLQGANFALVFFDNKSIV